MIAAGTTLQGRYIIERIIGQGGMGAVYLARQLALNERPVAVKHMSMPRGQATEQERAAAQFRQEASMLATLRHPNLVSVHDFFSEGSEYYLVMEYVEGATLDVVLDKTEGFLDVGKVVGWAQQLCEVLAYLHAQQPPVVFRDLKPANIMLDALGNLRLIDFGIAKSFQLQSATATFIIGAGTPGFAAPEQYGTTAVDARTDIYALGAVLYTLLTRQVPCDAIDRVLGRATLVPPSALNPQVGALLEGVVTRMMALQPEQRYATMRAAEEGLLAAQGAVARSPQRSSGGGRAAEASPSAVEESEDAGMSWTLVVVVILLLLGLSGLVMWQQEARTRSELERRMQVQSGESPSTGGVTPLPGVSSPPLSLATPGATVSPSPSAAPSSTPKPSATATALAVSSPTASPSPSAEPIVEASSTPTAAPSAASRPSPSASAEPVSSLPRVASSANIVTTGSGLMYQDIKVGDGVVPRPGDTVEVQYTAWLNNGTRIDSSADKGRPFKFTLGRGQVIRGWDEGISSMHAGGKRTLFIPPNLAYGAAGAPPSIPPNATLVLDVEIVGVEPQP